MRIVFEQPGFLLLLGLLPLLFFSRRSGIPFSSTGLLQLPGARSYRVYLALLPAFLRLAWLALLVFALAGPMRPETASLPQHSRRAIYFLLDVSGSMATIETTSEGKTQSRLDQAKELTTRWLNTTDPRTQAETFVGIVTFAKVPNIFAPLTPRWDVARLLLPSLAIDPLSDQTNLGDAIALALSRLQQFDGSDKAVVLLTDGAHNVPTAMDGMEAARIAAALAIPLHVIQIGTAATTVDPEGMRRDREYLQRYAYLTGGTYAQLENAAALPGIAQRLETAVAARSPMAWQSLRPAFLLFALITWLLEVIFTRLPWRIVPD